MCLIHVHCYGQSFVQSVHGDLIKIVRRRNGLRFCDQFLELYRFMHGKIYQSSAVHVHLLDTVYIRYSLVFEKRRK